MHIHILGICGTFMAGCAVIARQLGHIVTGVDKAFYPPMSNILAKHDIELYTGYNTLHEQNADIYLIGNALTRGTPVIETILNQKLPYISAPQWLAENVLSTRKVIAVAGTHGKTTTTSILTHILQQSGKDVGYLIGGQTNNNNQNAYLGTDEIFVIEADEYDSAFFDKRSKFIHYRPDILIINNLEFDHADIFADLDAIKQQFAHLIRCIPSNGTIIYPLEDKNVRAVLDQAHWSKLYPTSIAPLIDNQAQISAALSHNPHAFHIHLADNQKAAINWQLLGTHNIHNALSATAAALCVNLPLPDIAASLNKFTGVKRRLELISQNHHLSLYSDFAHHPTAIANTTSAIKKIMQQQDNLILIVELASNSMKAGVHQNLLSESVTLADQVIWYTKQTIDTNIADKLVVHKNHLFINDIQQLPRLLNIKSIAHTYIIVMTNADARSIITPIQAKHFMLDD